MVGWLLIDNQGVRQIIGGGGGRGRTALGPAAARRSSRWRRRRGNAHLTCHGLPRHTTPLSDRSSPGWVVDTASECVRMATMQVGLTCNSQSAQFSRTGATFLLLIPASRDSGVCEALAPHDHAESDR
jgi:hypothetical protein